MSPCPTVWTVRSVAVLFRKCRDDGGAKAMNTQGPDRGEPHASAPENLPSDAPPLNPTDSAQGLSQSEAKQRLAGSADHGRHFVDTWPQQAYTAGQAVDGMKDTPRTGFPRSHARASVRHSRANSAVPGGDQNTAGAALPSSASSPCRASIGDGACVYEASSRRRPLRTVVPARRIRRFWRSRDVLLRMKRAGVPLRGHPEGNGHDEETR